MSAADKKLKLVETEWYSPPSLREEVRACGPVAYEAVAKVAGDAPVWNLSMVLVAARQLRTGESGDGGAWSARPKIAARLKRIWNKHIEAALTHGRVLAPRARGEK